MGKKVKKNKSGKSVSEGDVSMIACKSRLCMLYSSTFVYAKHHLYEHEI